MTMTPMVQDLVPDLIRDLMHRISGLWSLGKGSRRTMIQRAILEGVFNGQMMMDDDLLLFIYLYNFLYD